MVGSRSSAVGQVGVGDKIIAINYQKLQTIKDLNEQLAKPENVCDFLSIRYIITIHGF